MSMTKRYLESIGFFENSEIDDRDNEFDWNEFINSQNSQNQEVEYQEELDCDIAMDLS